MSQQSEIYARHCEQNTRGQEPEWPNLVNGSVYNLCNEGERIGGTAKAYTSGVFQGVWRLMDGRIMERWTSFGWIEKVAIWPDEAAYRAYHRPMPREVYFSG